MFKTILLTTLVFLATAVAPSFVFANEPICVTQYGGAVVCGARTPDVHVPVKAGLADLNFGVVGATMLFLGGIILVKSKRSLTA